MGESGSVDCGENNFLKIFENFQKILKKNIFSQNFILFNTLLSEKKCGKRMLKIIFLTSSFTTLL